MSFFTEDNRLESYLKSAKSMIPLLSASIGDALPGITSNFVRRVIRRHRRKARKAKRARRKMKRKARKQRRRAQRDPVTGRFVRS